MITRKQYLETTDSAGKNSLHRSYFAQFITPILRERVERQIGVERILESKDPHFNNINLKEWDALFGVVYPYKDSFYLPSSAFRNLNCPRDVAAKFRDCGDIATLSGLVCTAKEIARQIVDEQGA